MLLSCLILLNATNFIYSSCFKTATVNNNSIPNRQHCLFLYYINIMCTNLFQDLKEAALKTLEKGLGRHLTQEAKASWDKMLKVAITVIVKELNRIESENK